MELEFWGVRGTFPVMDKRIKKFGGNTPSALLASACGDVVIIDAGTGIRGLGDKLMNLKKSKRPARIFIFFTHFHLDHIMGLPFFAPLYDANTEIVFQSCIEPEELRERLGRFMTEPFYPIELHKTEAKKIFKRNEPGSSLIGGFKISCCPLNHPQGSVAYKLEEGGQSVVFATDTEHPKDGIDERLADFARGASVFIYDATFTPREYEAGKQGWGHSTWREGTRLAKVAQVGRLLLSHLNPDHTDREIRKIERLAQKEFPNASCAYEGLRLHF
jgi:ribonuclease BN (tRNA processing enzyme)